MAAKRTGITLPKSLYDLAIARLPERHFETFSDYLAHLIREDMQRHTSTLHEEGDAYKADRRTA